VTHTVEVSGTLIGTARRKVLVTRDHVEGTFDGGETRFEVAIALIEASIDQPTDQSGARNPLGSGNLVE
jgi:hypothetical protein